MIKRILQQEDITFLNVYAPNQGALKYLKPTTNRKMGEANNTITDGDLNILLTALDRSSKQKNQQRNISLK